MIIEKIKYESTNPFKPFIFIGQKLNVNFSLPKIVVDSIVLTLANPLQVAAIKEIVKPDKLLSRHSQFGNPTNIYEYDFIKSKSEHGFNYTPVKLISPNFKYWIFEMSEYLADSHFVEALYLSSKNLTAIAQIGTLGNHINHFLISAVFYADTKLIFEPELELVENDLNELSRNYRLLKKFKSSNYETSIIGKAIKDYRNTLDIEYTSPFKIIALFSIIETILTNNQKNNGNSINRQLQKKILLINNQLNDKINFFDYFKGPDTLTEEIIIEKLYYYRSKVAHGDYYDFKKELQILTDQEKTCNFLEILLKRILVYAMEKPQLIIDLKEC